MNDIYTFTIPVFIKTLGGLKRVIGKAQAAVAAGQLQEDALMKDSLAPDMFPFVRQVQMSCDSAKSVALRLGGIDIPKHEDTETTLSQLEERIDATVAFLQTVEAGAFADAANVQVELPYFPGKYMAGLDYAREYAVPNFFFHAATAYGLVRKNGVPIGKADYINGMPLHDL